MRKSIDLSTLLSVNSMTLPAVELANRDSLPKAAAIYFIVNASELPYIGKSRNLPSRWNDCEHHTYPIIESGPTVYVSWLITDHRNLAFIETLSVE
jgi:hypothetical protein